MSKMATVPVFACRVCGKPVYFTHVQTAVSDPEGKILDEMMYHLSNVALCAEHRRHYNWYASQNRADEFFKNELNPQRVLYNILDESGLDYYGKNSG